MQNAVRTETIRKTTSRLDLATKLLMNLNYDIQNGVKEQDADQWNKSELIRYRTRYADDIRRIRRELLKAVKIFEDKE